MTLHNIAQYYCSVREEQVTLHNIAQYYCSVRKEQVTVHNRAQYQSQEGAGDAAQYQCQEGAGVTAPTYSTLQYKCPECSVQYCTKKPSMHQCVRKNILYNTNVSEAQLKIH